MPFAIGVRVSLDHRNAPPSGTPSGPTFSVDLCAHAFSEGHRKVAAQLGSLSFPEVPTFTNQEKGGQSIQ